jgi:hypothetical protein
MAKPSATELLKESIRQLEIKQAEEGKQLKEQVKEVYESLKPVNLLKTSLKEMAGSAELTGSLMESVVALFSGYLVNRVVAGSKKGMFAKILGLFMQFGVTKLVANHADTIREFVSEWIDRLFNRKEEAETESS